MEESIFGSRLKCLRLDSNMSMEKLAEALSITKSRINMWENGGVLPRKDMLLNLSQYFNVTVDYLLGNEAMEGKNQKNEELLLLHKDLEKLSRAQLRKVNSIIRTVFDDVFASA